jgi:hypothetical protein
MTPTWFVVPAAALVLGVAAFNPTPPSAAVPEPAFSGQQYGWDVPPQEYNEVQRRGFHDGVEGAHKDRGNGRRPDVNNRDEYRHPEGVPDELRHAYREAFRRGYEQAAAHLWGAPPPPPGAYAPGPPPPEPPPMRPLPPGWDPNYRWDMSGVESDIARRGFHDGLEGAQKDYGNRREPDVNNRDEYRHPDVPEQFQHDYREGFRRGYEAAARRLWGPA